MALNAGSGISRAALARSIPPPSRISRSSHPLRGPGFPRPAPSNRLTPTLGRRLALPTVAATKARFGSFQDMLQQSELMLVDFYATWCGPCAMMAQILEEAKQSVKHVTFAKVNTEKNPAVASQFGVQALPTLVLFRRGRPIARVEGVLNAADLVRWINEAAAAAR